MRITKKQLRRIIKEERQKLLKEQYGSRPETGSDLIEFAKAYAGLGDAVQSQLDEVVAAYYNGGFSPEFDEVVYEQNPAAIEMAQRRLGPVLKMMSDDDAQGIADAMEEAMTIYRKGDAEVEADARAAGDL